MNKNTLSVIVLLFLSVGVQAQENHSPTVSVSSYVANRYLGFGTGSVFSKDPVAQSDVLVSFSDGVYVDLWDSRSLKGKWNSGSLGDEINYGIGWKGFLAPGLSLNASTMYFDMPKVFSFGTGDFIYSRAFLTKDLKLLSIVAGYENYITRSKNGPLSRNLWSFGVSKRLSFNSFSLRTSALMINDGGTAGTDHGFFMRGRIGLDRNMNEHSVLNIIGINWYKPLTIHDKRKPNAMVYTGITFNSK